jgi:FMN-dependent oxidoreductase (nitrilotriacetate monooxygenase family)
VLQSVFIADSPGGGRDVAGWNGGLEPLTLLSALAAVTDRIGLIGTATTTFTDPYNLARAFASLDHISRGRAGWNIVTSANVEAAANFSTEPQSHEARYVRATEFVEVVTALWDSWEDDAQIYDQAAGRRFDLDKVHAIDHVGPAYRVRGPLNSPRMPQGWPLLVQAGSSDDGKAFAARFAEAIFTAQQSFEDARAFYAEVKARAAAFGRDPTLIKILPGLCAFVGSTTAEARRVQAELDDLAVPPRGPLGDGLLAFGGIDLSGFPPDEPVPLHLLPEEAEMQGPRSRFALIVALIRREHLTTRQLLRRLAGAPWPLHLYRDARRGGGPDRDMVQPRRRGRLQPHAAAVPGPVRDLRRRSGAHSAAPWRISHCIRGRDTAGTLWVAPSVEPVCRRAPRCSDLSRISPAPLTGVEYPDFVREIVERVRATAARPTCGCPGLCIQCSP